MRSAACVKVMHVSQPDPAEFGGKIAYPSSKEKQNERGDRSVATAIASFTRECVLNES